MINTNQILMDFVGQNWIALLLLYGIVRAMFPNSMMLTAIGETFSGLFPQLRKKDQP